MASTRAFGFMGTGGSSVWGDLTYGLIVVYLPAQVCKPFVYPYPDLYGFSIFLDSTIAAIEEI